MSATSTRIGELLLVGPGRWELRRDRGEVETLVWGPPTGGDLGPARVWNIVERPDGGLDVLATGDGNGPRAITSVLAPGMSGPSGRSVLGPDGRLYRICASVRAAGASELHGWEVPAPLFAARSKAGGFTLAETIVGESDETDAAVLVGFAAELARGVDGRTYDEENT